MAVAPQRAHTHSCVAPQPPSTAADHTHTCPGQSGGVPSTTTA